MKNRSHKHSKLGRQQAIHAHWVAWHKHMNPGIMPTWQSDEHERIRNKRIVKA